MSTLFRHTRDRIIVNSKTKGQGRTIGDPLPRNPAHMLDDPMTEAPTPDALLQQALTCQLCESVATESVQHAMPHLKNAAHSLPHAKTAAATLMPGFALRARSEVSRTSRVILSHRQSV